MLLACVHSRLTTSPTAPLKPGVGPDSHRPAWEHGEGGGERTQNARGRWLTVEESGVQWRHLEVLGSPMGLMGHT